MTEWLIASNNQYKTADLIACLNRAGISAKPYTDDWSPMTFPVETTDSYADNARLKAQFLAQVTGEPVIADDSGLEVPYLGDTLGVTTKRYLHQDHQHSDNETLLLALKEAPDDQRTATMTCTLCAVSQNADPVLATGTVTGTIAQTEQGHYSTGFDKLFVLSATHQTLAELPDDTRIPLTHRGQAAVRLAQLLSQRETNN